MPDLLTALVALLPAKLQPKAKGLVVALGALLGVVTLVVPDSPKWLTAAVFVATALGVYQVPALGYNRADGHGDGDE